MVLYENIRPHTGGRHVIRPRRKHDMPIAPQQETNMQPPGIPAGGKETLCVAFPEGCVRAARSPPLPCGAPPKRIMVGATQGAATLRADHGNPHLQPQSHPILSCRLLPSHGHILLNITEREKKNRICCICWSFCLFLQHHLQTY